MSFTLKALKPELADFIQQEMASGRYQSVDEVIEQALNLLVKRVHYEQWIEEMRQQVDGAIAQLDRGEGVDGEWVIESLRERLHSRKGDNQV